MADSKNKKLTPKQQKFVEEYLIDLNATQAAIRAGYSAKRANAIAHKLLTKADIQMEIQERRSKLSEKSGVDQDRIILEMKRLALFDVRSLFNPDGTPIPIKELSDDAAAAIVGVDVVVSAGNAETGACKVMKYRTPDKNKALENLAKILGFYERRSELEKLQAEKLRRELKEETENDDSDYRNNRRITIVPYDARLQGNS